MKLRRGRPDARLPLRRWLAMTACAAMLQTPLAAYAQTIDPLAGLSVEQKIAYQHKLTILRAVDTGNAERLQQHIDFVRMMQQSGYYMPDALDLNFPDQAGNTPAIRAAMQPNPEVMKVLLRNGATLDGVNHAGQSAVDVAYQYGNMDIANYLRGFTPGMSEPTSNSAGTTYGISSKALWIAGGVAVVGGGTAVALSGGGGSSGGDGGSTAGDSTHPLNANPASFNTAEARNQEGILGMNTQYALAHGYDGRIYSRDANGTLLSSTATGYVKVAVMDSGIDLTHPDLDGNIAAGSVSCTTGGCVSGGQSALNDDHGTMVAGLIAAERNGSGMHGVASQAKLISIRLTDDDGTYYANSAYVAGLKHAADNGVQVVNGSFGYDDGITAYIPSSVRTYLDTAGAGSTLEAQYQNLVSNDIISVYAAGNTSLAVPSSDDPTIPAALPYYFQGATAPAGLSQTTYDSVNPNHYDWSKHWIAAVSVNDSNSISSFSFQCGVAKNWCLAAPGEIAMSTQLGGGYVSNIGGTSFAAPNVSGAVAVMLGAFPHLEPEEVVQILFDTATDLGAAGVDDVYGHGLVNLRKAVDPTEGGWTLSGLGGQSYSFESSGFGLSPAFGNALAQSPASLQFLDAYGKNYTIGLSAVGSKAVRIQPFYERMARDADSFAQTTQLGQGMTLRFTPESKADPDRPQDDQTGVTPHFSFTTALPAGREEKASVTMNYKTNLAASLVPKAQAAIPNDDLRNPYLGLAEKTNSGVFAYEQGDTALTMAAYTGRAGSDDYAYRFNTSKPVSGAYSELAYRGLHHAQLGLQAGLNMEDNSLLGSETSGAFGIDSATTYHAGATARYVPAKNFTLFANYYMGLTQVSAAEHSLFTDFSSLSTNAFAFGATADKLTADSDSLSLVVSQPLRVNNGSANLDLPVGMERGGTTLFSSSRLNLAPTAREMDVGAYYTYALSPGSTFNFDSIFRMNPDHQDVDSEAAFLSYYRLNF